MLDCAENTFFCLPGHSEWPRFSSHAMAGQLTSPGIRGQQRAGSSAAQRLPSLPASGYRSSSDTICPPLTGREGLAEGDLVESSHPFLQLAQGTLCLVAEKPNLGVFS